MDKRIKIHITRLQSKVVLTDSGLRYEDTLGNSKVFCTGKDMPELLRNLAIVGVEIDYSPLQ